MKYITITRQVVTVYGVFSGIGGVLASSIALCIILRLIFFGKPEIDPKYWQ
jgi:hypothetical protein